MKPISLLSKYAFGVFLISSVIISCKKGAEQTKNSSAGYGNISYFAKASVSAGGKTVASIKSLALSDSAATTVVVDWASASVYVEKISFVGQSDNLLDTTITIEKKLNIFNADALAGVFQLPAGSYKNVQVKMFCKKSAKSDLAFNLRGTFTNTKGGTDSVLVASSLPFEANIAVTDIVIVPADKYKITFNFDLSKVLTGITNRMLETAKSNVGKDNKRTYIIWKGGSAEEPFFNQVIANWQTVASVVVNKE
ncbi:hypothetical protein [Mucilaginibacter paludis]|uniref:DUF4382 domain-containing protein n=1 Tax=Mucilaginibacter paludis DSM 18603 TaxID=714943 RepID=H1Y871_9SPHI|nr:hypothetical protein [Mucilaginibacter paludis]EHQ31093.1 hypothetical protein Mucpa_7049 [Mucilaginibacter paludis DSM 18603]